jgi:lipoprotein NlpD
VRVASIGRREQERKVRRSIGNANDRYGHQRQDAAPAAFAAKVTAVIERRHNGLLAQSTHRCSISGSRLAPLVEDRKMTGRWQNVSVRVLVVIGMAIALGACTITPWDSLSTPTSSAPVRTPGGAAANGVPAGFYRVNPGDTLQSVAGAFGQRAQDVANWNGLPPGAMVAPGQVLRVAPPVFALGSVGQPPPGGAVASLAPALNTPSPAPVSGVLAWPLRGPVLKPFVPGKTKGIVIGGRPGDPVRAAAAGRVVYAGSGIEAYGPLVIIKHDDSLITAYGQNGKLLVQEGEAVTQGQPVGEVGTDSSGVASIQFEVRKDGHPVDPLAWLPR